MVNAPTPNGMTTETQVRTHLTIDGPKTVETIATCKARHDHMSWNTLESTDGMTNLLNGDKIPVIVKLT